MNRQAASDDFGKLFSGDDGRLYVGGIDDETSSPIFKPVLKGWESFGGWYWFGIEKTEDNYEGKPVWYGLIQGQEIEFGYFTEAELDSMRGRIWKIPTQNLSYSGRREK
jgi:hypothetical protein